MSKTVTSEGLKHKLPRRVINPSSTSKGNRSIAHFERQNTFRDWKHDQLETNLKKVTNVDLDQEFITPEGNSQISTHQPNPLECSPLIVQVGTTSFSGHSSAQHKTTTTTSGVHRLQALGETR